MKKFEESFYKIINTKNYQFNNSEVKIYKMYAFMCYLSFLVLYPLFKNMHKKSNYMSFHINQGFVLFIFYILFRILIKVLIIIFSSNIFISLLLYLGNVLTILLIIFGLYNILINKSKELPFIGKFRIIK